MWAAPATFRMDDDYGRSRVFAQWLNTEEEIDCAIASCSVDCIHWVQKEQLPYLEHAVAGVLRRRAKAGTGAGAVALACCIIIGGGAAAVPGRGG